MMEADHARRAYVRELVRAVRGTLRGLEEELGMTRSGAAETFAATAALVPGGLARHTRRRPQNARAAVEVVRKFGRPADVGAPELGISARLARPRLSPRLGGLLGEAGPRAAAWVAERTDEDEVIVGKGIAATAPIALGALDRALEPVALADWVAMLPDQALTTPDGLLDANPETARIYRRMRRYGQPWLLRVTGIGG